MDVHLEDVAIGEPSGRGRLDLLDELGATVVTPREPELSGALLCVRSTDVNAVVRALEEQGIVTSCRDDNLRISAHCYNTAEDVQAVLDTLAARRDLLA